MNSSSWLDLLSAIRPQDPEPAQCVAAQERILARLALQQAPGRGAGKGSRGSWAPAGWGLGRAVACAVLALALLGTDLLGTDLPGHSTRQTRVDPESGATLTAQESWNIQIHAAAGGDALARMRLEQGGRVARQAVLTAVETGVGDDRHLALLSRGRTSRTQEEVERLAALAHDPALRGVVLDLLAEDVGPLGARSLGVLLQELPAEREALVEALGRVARGGRSEAAMRPLLSALGEGCTRAGVLALKILGASELDRWIAAVPDALVQDEALLATLRAAPATTQTRLVRLAERGSHRALELGFAAALPTFLPLAAEQANSAEESVAHSASQGLRTMGGDEAVLALARALDGPCGHCVLDVMLGLSTEQVHAAVDRARGSWRDTAAALRLLTLHKGEHGELWQRLAGEPRWGQRAVAALAASPDERAALWLAAIVRDGGSSASQAVSALGARARAGDVLARLELERLAAGPLARQVRALLDVMTQPSLPEAPGGPAARAWVRRSSPRTPTGAT